MEVTHTKRRSDRLRLAAVISYFPTSSEPHSGMPIFNQMRAMADIADLSLYVVRPQYPKMNFLRPRTFLNREYDPNYSISGMEMRYVSYAALPLLSRGLNGRSCAAKLLPLVRASQPDAILSYIVYPEGNAAVRVGEKLGVPVVVGAVGSDLRRIPDAWTRMLVKDTLRKAAHVVTKSSELRDQAIALGVSPAKVTAILNGCDAGVFRCRPRAEARVELSIEPDVRLAVFTGRLVEVKGLPHLIDAIRRVRETGERLQLAIIGDGPLLPRLQELCREKHLEGAVRFLGAQSPSSVARWLAASDLFCLSSYSEGSPNVILEALCCGRPVVATNVGGIPELVDAECGILVRPGDSSALADGIQRALRQSWNEQSISRVYRRGWDTMARETLNVCVDVVKAADRDLGDPKFLEAV